MERVGWEVAVSYAIRLVKWRCLLEETDDAERLIRNSQYRWRKSLFCRFSFSLRCYTTEIAYCEMIISSLNALIIGFCICSISKSSVYSESSSQSPHASPSRTSQRVLRRCESGVEEGEHQNRTRSECNWKGNTSMQASLISFDFSIISTSL